MLKIIPIPNTEHPNGATVSILFAMAMARGHISHLWDPLCFTLTLHLSGAIRMPI